MYVCDILWDFFPLLSVLYSFKCIVSSILIVVLTTCSYSFAIVGRKQEKEKKAIELFIICSAEKKRKKLLLYLEKRRIDAAMKLSALRFERTGICRHETLKKIVETRFQAQNS